MAQKDNAAGILNHAFCAISGAISRYIEPAQQAEIYRAVISIAEAVPQDGYSSTINADFVDRCRIKAEICEGKDNTAPLRKALGAYPNNISG